MKMSSNGNIFRVTGPLCVNSPATGEFPAQRPVTRSFGVFFICAWIKGWVNNLNNREAGDLRRHYDIIVMNSDKSDVNIWVILVVNIFSLLCVYVSLQWRHNERDGVWNHRRLNCLLNCYFRRRSQQNIKAPPHWPLWGEWPVNSPQKVSNKGNDDVIM